MLRKLLLVVFCAVTATGIGFYVYQTHAYLVWGLLFLCWACYRLTLRANHLFGTQNGVRVSVPLTGNQNGETTSIDTNR